MPAKSMPRLPRVTCVLGLINISYKSIQRFFILKAKLSGRGLRVLNRPISLSALVVPMSFTQIIQHIFSRIK